MNYGVNALQLGLYTLHLMFTRPSLPTELLPYRAVQSFQFIVCEKSAARQILLSSSVYSITEVFLSMESAFGWHV
jgi:hypothetical protein